MKTVIIQIGNSDDKLTQKEWSQFHAKIDANIGLYAMQIHFHGSAATWETWQNVCWVFVIKSEKAELLRERVKQIREAYKQDSVAWTEGETAFV